MRREDPFSLTKTAGEKRLQDVARQQVQETDRRKRKEIWLVVLFGIFVLMVVFWLMSRGVGGQWLRYAAGGMWMAFTIARANYMHRAGRKISRLELVLSVVMIFSLVWGLLYLHRQFEYLQQIFNLT
ncbi:MAG: hypothetical protein ACK4PK_02375 [Alphaproteobacteria bacterium]